MHFEPLPLSEGVQGMPFIVAQQPSGDEEQTAKRAPGRVGRLGALNAGCSEQIREPDREQRSSPCYLVATLELKHTFHFT